MFDNVWHHSRPVWLLGVWNFKHFKHHLFFPFFESASSIIVDIIFLTFFFTLLQTVSNPAYMSVCLAMLVKLDQELRATAPVSGLGPAQGRAVVRGSGGARTRAAQLPRTTPG